jgi:hypothetical protein
MLERLKSYWERITYYQFIDNWHKFQPLSKLMCRAGRHDYEYFDTLYDQDGIADGALLYCFYCERQKKSWFRSSK